MMAPSNIVLVGFMGTGKTSAGKRLAARFGLIFVDMDHVIEERAAKPIPRIFADDGEPHFRAMERALVQELSARKGLVIATGGGIVLNPDNLRDFSRSGLVVCLSATPDAILQRIGTEIHRPLLAGDDKREKIAKLLDSRRRLYDVVPCQVDTTGLAVEAVVERIASLYAADTLQEKSAGHVN